VQNGGDADVGAEMLVIGRDRQHGVGRGVEQQIVDHCLILMGDIGDRTRQCEHDVQIAYPRPPASHISSCKGSAAFLKRSPDTATAEVIRRFRHLARIHVLDHALRRSGLTISVS
jgi:hypothetical protein